jgi:hypothetical protein
MKKSIIITLVMVITSIANAEMLISVNGVIDPPETQFFTGPSGIFTIDIWGDGQSEQGLYWVGINRGDPASLNFDNATILYPGNSVEIGVIDDDELAQELGFNNIFAYFLLADTHSPPPPLQGTLVDQILFHCEGFWPPDATIMLLSEELSLMDTQVIHVPEPMTVVLLGLGGLMMRRRR